MARVNRAMSPRDLDHPGCICGREMRLATVEPTLIDASTTVHSFECIGCGHLLKVMHEGSRAAEVVVEKPPKGLLDAVAF
jgi:hypothetical protein